jgi:thymidine phosphorylase
MLAATTATIAAASSGMSTFVPTTSIATLAAEVGAGTPLRAHLR